MLRKITFAFGLILFAAGLISFFIPNWFYLIQFDLSQSLAYSIIGAVGIVLVAMNKSDLILRRYLTFLAIFNLALLMIGLSFPNFADIVHLEVPEHFSHAAIGLVAAILSDIYKFKK